MSAGATVSIAERDRAVRFLGYHRDAGGLDAAAYAERLKRASAAKTHDELHALFADLEGLTELPGAQRGALVEDLLELHEVSDFGVHRPSRRTPGGLLSTSNASQGWMVTGFLALLWATVNVVGFIAWFLVAMVTVEVEFWPRTVLGLSTILLVVGSCLLTRGYGLFGRGR